MASGPTGDGAYVITLLRELLRINSVNPMFGEKGAAAEGAIAAYVASVLRRIGVATQVHECAPGRVSVVGVLKGSGGGRSLMLNGHLDTVALGGMKAPLEGRVEGGRIYGRGAYDMKGGVAACIAAVRRLAETRARLRGDVVLALVADEEDASLGMLDVVKRYPVDGAVVTEPTGEKLALAHRGFMWVKVTTTGRACHGSRFDLGIDANMMMGRYLSRLGQLEREVRTRRAHPLAGPPSLHAPLIRGGVGASIYSPVCELHIERRTAPGEDRETVLADFRRIADNLAREDDAFRAAVEEVMWRSAFQAQESSAVAAAVAGAHRSVVGAEPQTVGAPFWTDAAILREAGTDVVVYGPDGAGAHEDEEWVDAESVKRLAEVLTSAAMSYCR